MNDFPSFGKGHDGRSSTGVGLIVFGGEGEFSPGFVSMVAAELGAGCVERLPALSSRLCRFADCLTQRTVALVDIQDIAPDRRLNETVSVLTKEARLVLAYRHPEAALEILRPAIRAARSGHLSFLPRSISFDLLSAVLGVIARGGAYFPPELIDGLAIPFAERDGDAGLSDREMEVIDLISTGMQNKAVANSLNITECTVKLHVTNILRKLKVRNRTAAVRWYLSR